MSPLLVVSITLASTLFAFALRSMQREDASSGLALATTALAVLAPFPFCILFAPIGGLAFYVHGRAIERARRDQEAVLRHIGAEAAAGVRIEEVRDRRALHALQRFREAQRVLADGAVRESEERRAEGRSTNVRSRFMAAMGHELRSPLNSIIGFATVLEDGADGPLTPAQRENVSLVRLAAEELLLLLTDILDSSRLEAGRVKLDRKWTASVEILTLTTQRARPLLDVAERELEAEVQPGLPPLFVDRARIAQSLQNLLRQALKGSGKRAA